MDQRLTFDLDQQPPLPVKAAEDYSKTALDWSATPMSDVIAHRDIAYGPDRRQRYDVFAPPHASNAPILVFFHGGGWTNGYKEWTGFMAEAVTQHGLVLVAPSYRLAPAHRLPAAFEDGVEIIKALAHNVKKYGADATRIFLSGHSAGGHIATLVALRTQALIAAGLAPNIIRGCLPVSGILDLHHPAPPAGSLEERIYTHVLERASDDAPMSPICWAAGNNVPMLMSHGDRDSGRVVLSNARFEAILAAQASPVERIVESGDHFQTHLALRDPDHPWYARLAALAATI